MPTLEDMLIVDLGLKDEIEALQKTMGKAPTPQDEATVSKDSGFNLPPQLAAHSPADQDLVSHATGIIRQQWGANLGRLREPREWLDELSANDLDSIVKQVSDHWDTVYQQCLPRLHDVVAEAVQRGMIHMPHDNQSVEHLNALGAEWLEVFGRTMMHRWVSERLLRAITNSTNSMERQSLAIVKAVEAIPDAFEMVMQPLIRRLLSFGAILQEMERHEPLVTVQKAREQQKYVIITANDTRVCEVCKYLQEIGSFWLADALDLFDNFLDAVDEEDLEAELSGDKAWLPASEILSMTKAELKAAGQIIPPFHPNCRCGVAFVRD
jgi:hypothetical protein